MKKIFYLFITFNAMCCLTMTAQVKIKAIGEMNRYDGKTTVYENGIAVTYEKGTQMPYINVGWNAALQKSIFIAQNGIYAFNVDENSVSTPVKEPAVNINDFHSGKVGFNSSTGTVYVSGGEYTDNDKALWANNFNLMAGNSGAVYIDGILTTVFSRDYQSTTDEELFAVRKWDAKTGALLNTASEYHNASANLESAGMAYNPVDGKVYGLFYLTAQQLSSEFTDDPDFFVDEDGESSSEDAGYCICTIDLSTMKITPITPGLYYYNFITFAINSEGRAFALTSGGTSGAPNADGKIENIDGELAGAQLCEFDLASGMMLMNAIPAVDEETGEPYTEYENIYPATGYCSQYRRQSACFAASNPYKMYWNGYVNSGKGINDIGSWSSLSDKEWIENEKYDTAIYEIDITTGNCRRVGKVPNRWIFSCMWIEGDDTSDGSGLGQQIVTNGIQDVKAHDTATQQQILNVAGQQVSSMAQKGLYIVKDGKEAKKVLVK